MAVINSKNLNQISATLFGFFLQTQKLQSSQIQKFNSKHTLLLRLQEERYQSTRYIIIYQGKTQLDWKKVRANYLYADTFFALVNYNPEGPKTEVYPSYCKISHINHIRRNTLI